MKECSYVNNYTVRADIFESCLLVALPVMSGSRAQRRASSGGNVTAGIEIFPRGFGKVKEQRWSCWRMKAQSAEGIE